MAPSERPPEPAADSKRPGRRAAGRGGPRTRAREVCLKVLYQWEVVGDPLPELAQGLEADARLPEEVRAYALHLVSLVLAGLEEIDAALKEALDRWELGRLPVVDRSVLRLGVAELLYEPHLATGIILDECIEIAKRYGAPQSGKFVNGVLDGVARAHRPGEQ